RPSEEAQRPLPLGRAVERHAHAIQQIDDARRPIAHLQHGRLIGEKIPAQHRLVEVHPLGVTLLTRDFVAGVDPALGAYRVRAFGVPLRAHALSGNLRSTLANSLAFRSTIRTASCASFSS